MKLISPKGTDIVGTLETLQGVSGIASVKPVEKCDNVRPVGHDGLRFDIDYDGQTDVWWNEQRTVERDGERVFVDDAGNEFK